MFVSCKISGHKFQPYRYRWVEFIPDSNKPNVNRDGAYTLSHVYCSKCGLLKEVVNTNGKHVRYTELPT